METREGGAGCIKFQEQPGVIHATLGAAIICKDGLLYAFRRPQTVMPGHQNFFADRQAE